MKPLGSIAALVAAIREDAAAEAEALAARADRAVTMLTSDPASCPPRFDDDQRAVAAARDRARVRVAQEDWHDARDAVAQREEWIARVISLGAGQLQERLPADEAREALATLAREAIQRLPAGVIELAVSESDEPLLDLAWRAGISRSGDADDIRVVVEPIGGGCIARSADGRASFDNTYAARSERLQAQWRAALADFYERVTAQITVEREAGG
jgi:vacuolar-type H+-ATPase subunit E/Vma4